MVIMNHSYEIECKTYEELIDFIGPATNFIIEPYLFSSQNEILILNENQFKRSTIQCVKYANNLYGLYCEIYKYRELIGLKEYKLFEILKAIHPLVNNKFQLIPRYSLNKNNFELCKQIFDHTLMLKNCQQTYHPNLTSKEWIKLVCP